MSFPPIARLRCRVLMIAGVLALLGSTAAQARLMTVDDYVKIRSLGPVEVSAAGELVAVLVSRTPEEGDNFRVPVEGESRIPLRNDLLVMLPATGRTVYEVYGKQDGSSVLSARWSPDGSKLAYLRADRRGDVSLAIWDAASRRSRTLVASGVRPFYPYVRWAGSDKPAASFAWISADELLFTQAGDAGAAALDPESSTARARVGGNSVRVWQTSNVSMCRPFDRLATVRLNGAVREVARGPILGASLAPDASAIAVVTAVKHLQPPKAAPLPAHLYSQPAADGTPFMQWQVAVLTRGNGKWKPAGAPVIGTGSITPFALPTWKPDSSELAFMRQPDPFAMEEAVEILHLKRDGTVVSTQSFPSYREGRAALASVENAGAARAAPDPSTQAVPPELVERIGQGAQFSGATRSGSRLFLSRAGNAQTLWAVNGDAARVLVEVNQHLRDVAAPEPVPVKYAANGEERTGWLHLPPGSSGPVPVMVTAYPLTRGIPPALALAPEGTFPVLYELLARGVAVYVADLRIQMPGPSVDEPVKRILTEMDASVSALKASGKVDPARIFFFGHSFGGYTAVTLLAHTSYFHGIVAAAPLGDLVSYAFSGQRGHYNPRCEPAQVLARQMMHEYPGSSDLPPVNNLIMKMGGPPYELLEKYVRNSPLLNIRNASTPTLIIQGSEDAFADGGRLFNTLYRMGLDAELLYYWGEGHIVYAPANVRDMTQRTLDWVMDHMKGGASEGGP